MILKYSNYIEVEGGRLYIGKEDAALVYCRNENGVIKSSGYVRFRRNFSIDKAFHDCSCFVAYEDDSVFFNSKKRVEEISIDDGTYKKTEFPGDLMEVEYILYITKENKNKHQKAVIATHDILSQMIEIIYPKEKITQKKGKKIIL